jgi:hypothetical protein
MLQSFSELALLHFTFVPHLRTPTLEFKGLHLPKLLHPQHPHQHQHQHQVKLKRIYNNKMLNVLLGIVLFLFLVILVIIAVVTVITWIAVHVIALSAWISSALYIPPMPMVPFNAGYTLTFLIFSATGYHTSLQAGALNIPLQTSFWIAWMAAGLPTTAMALFLAECAAAVLFFTVMAYCEGAIPDPRRHVLDCKTWAGRALT